jgi:hypothetical protein
MTSLYCDVDPAFSYDLGISDNIRTIRPDGRGLKNVTAGAEDRAIASPLRSYSPECV